MFESLRKTIEAFHHSPIRQERLKTLDALAEYVSNSIKERGQCNLLFVCTHNSRRSQMAQVWGQALAHYFRLPVKCSSGGTEETAFYRGAVNALEKCGFEIETLDPEARNPVYQIHYAEGATPIRAWSKKYDEAIGAPGTFAAVMTCSHADENCPYIPGAAMRISLHYHDPKDHDGQPSEQEAYIRTCKLFGSELYYVFQKSHQDLNRQTDTKT
ncbi:MAG: protein-tyrosine-phosphatase [Salibacteraceae bacterium]